MARVWKRRDGRSHSAASLGTLVTILPGNDDLKCLRAAHQLPCGLQGRPAVEALEESNPGTNYRAANWESSSHALGAGNVGLRLTGIEAGKRRA
jgi:hypothetical protein